MKAKSVTDIFNVLPNLLFTSDDNKPGACTIVCKVCADYRSEVQSYTGEGTFGIPTVDIDRHLTDLGRTNRWSTNLRTRVNDHLDT